MPKQIGHSKALRPIGQDTPEGRAPARRPHMEPNTSPLQAEDRIAALEAEVAALKQCQESLNLDSVR